MAFTHIKHCGGVAGRNVLGTLLKFQSSLLNYFLLSGFQLSLLHATDRISEHTAPKYGTKPIRYVTLAFEIGAAQLRSVTEIAPPQPFLCLNKPYPV